MDLKVFIPIAQGSEELEAVTIIDLLRRAGLKVIVAAQHDIVTCSRAVKIIPDVLFRDIEDDFECDAIVIPGGTEGTENLMKSKTVEELLRKLNSEKKQFLPDIKSLASKMK